jgi:hypothetical protein
VEKMKELSIKLITLILILLITLLGLMGQEENHKDGRHNTRQLCSGVSVGDHIGYFFNSIPINLG